MERSLEQLLQQSAHQAVDDLSRLIAERGLPHTVSITFYFEDVSFSHDVRVIDSTLDELDSSIVSSEGAIEIPREAIREEVERVLDERTLSSSSPYFYGGNPLVSFNTLWGVVAAAEGRLAYRIARLEEAARCSWWQRLTKWWQR